MKKRIIVILLCALYALCSYAQLTVSNNGWVGVGTLTPANSILSVGEGNSHFVATINASQFDKCGLYVDAHGNGQLPFAIGIQANSIIQNNTHKIGVFGNAMQSSSDVGARAIGVRGLAGNTPDGYNYGVLGSIGGNSNGAGVFGSSYGLMLNMGSRYAGFFHGTTEVVGDFLTSSSISGLFLSRYTNTTEGCEQTTDSYIPRLEELKVVPYYINNDARMENCSTDNLDDPDSETPILSQVQTQIQERVHYGLHPKSLKMMFPELVYEQEDGEIGINYVELIPVLVHTINELNQRISILEGKNGKTVLAANSQRVDDESLTLHGTSSSSETTVSYRLPSNSKSAEILVCDLSGHVKKVVDIPKGKSNTFSFPTDGLENGIYIYSLIVDGEVYATKRIVVRH